MVSPRARRGLRARLRATILGTAVIGALGCGAALGAAQSATTTVITAPAVPVFLPSAPVHPGRRRIPVLMYHVIEAAPPNAAFPGLWVSPQEFAGQMHALAHAGFQAISLDQAGAYWRYGAQLPPHPIVVTFDNGYASQYTAALPILRAMGWIGDLNLQISLHAPQGLTPKRVQAMIADGWELDSQTFSHPDLTTLDAAQLQYQIVRARTRLQRMYRVPVNWFCYPSGHYNPKVVSVVRSAGYVGATTVIFGWGSSADTYRLARLRVLGGTSPQSLVSMVEGNQYDGPPPVAYPGG